MKTALYDWHIAQSAKMVPFAAYDMPVQYPNGVLKEHLHTRANAGLFDVSHMGQVQLRGENIAAELEKLLPADLQNLGVNQQTYSLFTNEQGGVLDDLMILNRGDHFHLVVNAACKQQDIAYLEKHLPKDVHLTELKDHALLALQGPKAKDVLAKDIENLDQYKFMQGFEAKINDIDCLLTRSGYTGEDGFEISCHNTDAVALAEYLTAHEAVEPIGLGARDSLRLEAGLCLYGHDLNENISPVAANLKWAIHKTRRSSERANFIGADIILSQLENGTATQRVGLAIEGRAPVREGSIITNEQGDEVGEVCSGGFSPSLEKPIAMAYVDSKYAALGTSLFAQVRKKSLPVSVAKLPFVANNYFR